ncbi:hypothetical protein G3N58_24200, partial [Paraburkholderia sp. Ac-20342]|uniref:hypothetical protein n=1 Tax=Paraburkholderia sp. Ac-20342 TaxID=2703889 RepID=UPI00197F0E0E
MGYRMAKDNLERPAHGRGTTGSSPSRCFARRGTRRLGSRFASPLMRGLACWLALQTALAAPLAGFAPLA